MGVLGAALGIDRVDGGTAAALGDVTVGGVLTSDGVTGVFKPAVTELLLAMVLLPEDAMLIFPATVNLPASFSTTLLCQEFWAF